MKKGFFITLEGIEGAGKSTQINSIQSYLKERKIDFIATREPGGTDLNEEIRELLLRNREAGIGAMTELLLMFAARAEHLQKTILPALNQGQWVVCDRFTDASYAYQGGGRGLDRDMISTLERWVQKELRPDLTLYLDLPVCVSRSRIKHSAADRFERADDWFFERVRQSYLDRANQYPDIFQIIDGTQTQSQVSNQIKEILNGLVSS